MTPSVRGATEPNEYEQFNGPISSVSNETASWKFCPAAPARIQSDIYIDNNKTDAERSACRSFFLKQVWQMNQGFCNNIFCFFFKRHPKVKHPKQLKQKARQGSKRDSSASVEAEADGEVKALKEIVSIFLNPMEETPSQR